MEKTAKITTRKEEKVAYSFMMLTVLLMELVLSLQGIKIVNKVMKVRYFNRNLEAIHILLLIVLIIMIATTVSMRKNIGSSYKKLKNFCKKMISIIIAFSVISILLFINIGNAGGIVRTLIGVIMGNALYEVLYLELLEE